MKKKKLRHIKRWSKVIRDVGVTLGIPVLLAVGVYLHNQQVSILEAQIDALSTMSYDKALDVMRAQTELYADERTDYEQRLSSLEQRVTPLQEQVLTLRKDSIGTAVEIAEQRRRLEEAEWNNAQIAMRMDSLQARLASLRSMPKTTLAGTSLSADDAATNRLVSLFSKFDESDKVIVKGYVLLGNHPALFDPRDSTTLISPTTGAELILSNEGLALKDENVLAWTLITKSKLLTQPHSWILESQAHPAIAIEIQINSDANIGAVFASQPQSTMAMTFKINGSARHAALVESLRVAYQLASLSP